MLRSFFIITLRILWRNKVTSFVNIFSLTIGMTAFMLIMLYVHHETSYDKFNENYDRIYRLEADNYARLHPTFGTYVKSEVPEVLNITRMAGFYDGLYITYSPENDPENIKQIEVDYAIADSSTFDVFTFPLIQGDPKKALIRPFTAVISESAAKKLFGIENPMNSAIKCFGHQFQITGIMKDIKNFHADIDILFSQESMPVLHPNIYSSNSAGSSVQHSATYLLTTSGVDQKALENKINQTLADLNNGELVYIKFNKFHLRPLKDIYFNGVVKNLDYGQHGNYKLIQIFFTVAIFILLMGIINYINLTTAKSSLRSKEMAIKKVSGSSGKLLGLQLILESMTISLIAFMLAITFIQSFSGFFKTVFLMGINPMENFGLGFLAIALCGVIFIGLLAGIYPAILLTSYHPVSLIKKTFNKSAGGTLVRKGLMTMQFTVTVVLMIGIIVNYRQLNFARNMNPGFSGEQVITVIKPNDMKRSMRNAFKDRLLQESTILKVSFSYGNPGDPSVFSVVNEIDGIKRSMIGMPGDPDYISLMGIKIVEGNDFSWDRPGEYYDFVSNSLPERYAGIIINESAVKEFDLKNPIGKTIVYPKNNKRYKFKIIGVVRDFNFQSIHHKIEPLFIVWGDAVNYNYINIKCNTSDIASTINVIKKDFRDTFGPQPLVYHFLHESYDRQYQSDERSVKVIGYFTALAITIACMGLFALSSFMAIRRTKEIGIRKALGASSMSIFVMLSREYIKWILLSILIASPIAWFLMNSWLQDFAYRIDLGVDTFILAALLALTIGLLTVGWQALKSANANPVEALRYE